MEQEHRIAYKAGITRTPSDFLCADGELAECINLATDNEELKPIVQPAEKMEINRYPSYPSTAKFKLLFAHKFKEDTRYIIGYCANPATDTSWDIYWSTNGTISSTSTQIRLKDNTNLKLKDGSIKVTAIGKILILSDEDGMRYFKWELSSYSNIVYPIPDIKFEAKMVRMTNNEDNFVRNSANPDGIIENNTSQYSDDFYIVADKRDEYNDLVVGLYSKNLKQIARNKCFAEPFFIRAALEMIDGTYTYITNPILLWPSYDNNTRMYIELESMDPKSAIVVTQALHLYINQSTDFSDYSDIIKDVVVFASKGVPLYQTSLDERFSQQTRNTLIGYCISSLPPTTDYGAIGKSTFEALSWEPTPSRADRRISLESIRCLEKRDTTSVNKDLESVSIFYKIASLGLKPLGGFTDISSKTTNEVIENLTTQEWIRTDDYYSRCQMVPEYIYSYNSRLNLGNVGRGFFEGFGFFMPLDQDDSYFYTFDVTIKTDNGEVFAARHIEYTNQMQGIYFYYPDARATHVKIYKYVTDHYELILDKNLKEHPSLNGAYYYAGLSANPTEPTRISIQSEIPAAPTPDPEALTNYLLQSEVNNPWVFKAEGYVAVGTGKILGMSTITQALSQGQFGQYPLLVFSESGIWGLAVGNDGYYSAIYPMSRDVCINPGSILQTDGAVFFVSKKGLMLIAGNDVRCVSEQMNGVTFNTSTLSPLATGTEWVGLVTVCQTSRSFLDYIRDSDCFMAYDYIDSRILIINPNFSFAFAYNIADGTIAKTVLPAAMTGAVNNYPDYLLQGTWTEQVEGQTVTHNYVYSFYEKPREEQVADRTLGFLLTRPMKLAGPVSQASLRQLMNVGTWNKGTTQNPLSCVKTDIYLSEDMQTWYNDISRHGAAARYYRLALFVKMLPTERLSGTILTSQERRGNHMR